MNNPTAKHKKRKLLPLISVVLSLTLLSSCLRASENEGTETDATRTETDATRTETDATRTETDGETEAPETSVIELPETAARETEGEETEAGEAPPPAYGFELYDYVNRDGISEYASLTEDQKIAFDALCIALEDILTNGPTPYKTYLLEKRILWLDYKTARNLFCANYTAAEDLITWITAEDSVASGTDRYVDSIQLNGYEAELLDQAYRAYLEVKNEAERILSTLTHDGTEYGKAHSIAKWVVDNWAYAYDHEQRMFNGEQFNTAYSSIINRDTICDGYAKGFDYLCKRAGLETIYVTGMAGGWHAWNMICIDEEWYHIDTTWMDGEGSFYRYFMMSDIICRHWSHTSWEYYWYQVNNTKISPTADSFAYYRYGYLTVDALLEYLAGLPASEGYSYQVIVPTEPVERMLALHGSKITSESDGKEYYIRIFAMFEYGFSYSIGFETQWDESYEAIAKL